MAKLRYKRIPLKAIWVILLGLIAFCPVVVTKNPTKYADTPSSLTGLTNVTISVPDLPQPDFDLERRFSEEEEMSGSINTTTTVQPRKKKKKQKNTALKRAINEAARKGIEAMHNLYDTLEPAMKRKGELLSPMDPAAQLSIFSAPHLSEELDQSKAAYAALYAAKKLKESCDVDYLGLGRQTQTKLSLRRTALESLCPPRDAPRCLPASRRYRTHDGTCNNDRKLRQGSAQMPFHRFLQPDYSDGVENIRTAEDGGALPSARFVSLVVHGARADEAPVTMMLAQWGQFIDHDLTATSQPRSINGSVPRCCGSDVQHPNCLTIRVPADDPWLSPLNVRCLEFLRSAPAQRHDCVLSWREQINQATSYLDASTVYASNPRSADNNRLFRDGLLIFGRGPPRDDVCLRGALANHCVRPGDARSGEQPGLMAMHTVWVAEHNRIANELGRFNSHWSDEKLYQEARRIVGAMVQHITYREFLPLVLGREVCRLFDLQLMTSGYYMGYEPKVNPTVANSFGGAAFRFGHSLVQGSLMRSDRNHRFMLTNVTLHEEFGKGDMGGPGSLHRLVRGMLMQRALKRDEFISAELTNHLFQSNSFPFGLDLAAINIQRGRDHGLPAYTSWRVPCGLSPIHSWRDLINIFGPQSTDRIRQAYQSVNDIDLFVGGLAERPVIGGLVGPTFACILAQQFSNLRKGDRFWYENGGTESSFTPAQLSSIRQVTLSQVLCRQVNGGTLQPHAFLPPDMAGNERQFCGEQSLIALDLIPWTERDPLNKQHDLTSPQLLNRPTIIALKPQLINSPTINKKKKNKNKTKKRKRPTVAPKEAALDTKLNLDQDADPLTKKKENDMTLVVKTSGHIDSKLDIVTPTTEQLQLRPRDKLDFDDKRTTLQTKLPSTTDAIQSRSIVEKSPMIPIVNWEKRDPNTLHIAITWNHPNSAQRPEKRPVAPMLHDKISSVDEEIQFLSGTGGSGIAYSPTYPPPTVNSPFSYDTITRPPATNNNGPLTYWTVNDVPVVTPQVFDIRNTVKPKPVSAHHSTYYYPTSSHQYQTNNFHFSKRPTYIYSSYKQTVDKDTLTPLTSISSSSSLAINKNQTPFSIGNSNLDSVIEAKALPTITDEKTNISFTFNETVTKEHNFTTTSSLLQLLDFPSTLNQSVITTTYNTLMDEDFDDYDNLTVLPPVLSDNDKDGNEDENTYLTQFDKDGYLRPEYMNFDQLTADHADRLNKDFHTQTSLTEPRRPALDIDSDLDLTTNKQQNEKIAFVPLKILNSADRPDDWWIKEGPEKAPMPTVPEISVGSDFSKELPKPMFLL